MAPSADFPGSSDEGHTDENPTDSPSTTHDPVLRVDVDDEDEDEIGDEGFYDDDDDDDSLGPTLKGSGSSVLSRKDEIHAKHAQPQQHLEDDSGEDEAGSSNEVEGSSTGSGSGNIEVRGQGSFAR